MDTYPLLLQAVNFWATCTFDLCICQRFCESTWALGCRADDMLMVGHVNIGRKKLPGFGVSARNEKHSGFQEVQLESSSDKSRNVGRCRYKDLATQVTALFPVS